MNWLTNLIRPKIRSMVEQKEVPDNLWQKCPSCEGMLFHRDLAEQLNVCYHCGHHMKLSVVQRIRLLLDEGHFREVALPKAAVDPLKFKDKKKYADRIRDTRAKTGRQDAILVGSGTMGGLPVVVAALDFEFMGGSMGQAVGDGLIAAAREAVRLKAALIAVPASGGARMQEGAISLMQMPRSIVAVEMVKNAGLPYIVLLTDPTTGGVSASFAMVGDIHVAEPGCMIGFAGKRVIQETIREELPDGFQTAEYLLDHGMVDMVVERKDLRERITRLLDLLMRDERDVRASKGGSGSALNGGGGRKVIAEKTSKNVVSLNVLKAKKATSKPVKKTAPPKNKATNKKAATR